MRLTILFLLLLILSPIHAFAQPAKQMTISELVTYSGKAARVEPRAGAAAAVAKSRRIRARVAAR